VDAVSFFFSAALVATVIRSNAIPSGTVKKKYSEDLAEGLRFLFREKLMLAIMIMVMVTNFMDAAFAGVILPVYVKEVYGSPLGLGFLFGASGAGAVVGALVYSAIGHRMPRHATFVSMFVLTSLRFWVFILYPPLSTVILVTFLTSIGAGPLNPIISAVEYERIPAKLRGRVLGAIQAGAWAAMPMGMLLGGILTDQFGLQSNLIGLGCLYLITTLAMAVVPVMRGMNVPKQSIA
jgi:MFS family permease